MINCDFVNLEELSLAIDGDKATGVDPRTDVSPSSQYYQLKDQRRALRDSERSALMNDDASPPMPGEWFQLAQDIYQALTTNSKDLEYGAWLIEALCRSSGFVGLAQSFSCARLLIERFWDELYPSPDEDGLETRIAPLVGLNGYDGDGALISPILSIPIVSLNSDRNFATWHYIRASEQSRKEDSKKSRSEQSISLEEIEQMVAETSPEYFISFLADIEQAMVAFEELSSAMDMAMGGAPQPTSSILKAMQQCRDTVHYLTKDKLNAYNEANVFQDDVDADAEAGSPASGSVSTAEKQVQNRQQVLHSLQEAANFFRKTEPHSPISYALEQVIHWSNLALPELLQELIDDNNSRSQFFRLTGINKTSDNK